MPHHLYFFDHYSRTPLWTVQGASSGTTHPDTRAVVAWLLLRSESSAAPSRTPLRFVQGANTDTINPVTRAVVAWLLNDPSHRLCLSQCPLGTKDVDVGVMSPG